METDRVDAATLFVNHYRLIIKCVLPIRQCILLIALKFNFDRNYRVSVIYWYLFLFRVNK